MPEACQNSPAAAHIIFDYKQEENEKKGNLSEEEEEYDADDFDEENA